MNVRAYAVFLAVLAFSVAGVEGALNVNTNINPNVISNIRIATTTTTVQCPDTEAAIRDCKAKGMDYTKYMTGSCVLIQCTQATTTTAPNNQCPNMEAAIEECLANGMDYTKVMTGNCVLIQCTQTATTLPGNQCPDVYEAIKKCGAQGMGYTNYTYMNCMLIQCVTTTTQPAQQGGCPDVQQQMSDCKQKGGTISRRYDENKCAVIDCTAPSSNCPPASDVEAKIAACKQQGLDYVTYAKDGCRYAECVQRSNCPSESDLEYAIRKCKAQGLAYQTYADQNGCRQVKCVQQSACPTADENTQRMEECRKAGKGYTLVPTGAAAATAMAYIPCNRVECVELNQTCPSVKDDIEACRIQGKGVEYYVDDSQCERARCKETPAGNCPQNGCPTDEQLKDRILKCGSNGMGYEFYNQAAATTTMVALVPSCRNVRCVQKACPSDAEIKRSASDCEQKKMKWQTYADENGCRGVKCVVDNSTCPTYELLSEVVKACREKQLGIEVYVDDNGCKNVRCKEPDSVPTTDCKKLLQGDCIIISCSDGYTFDSCSPQGQCPQTECKTFKDEKGCNVKRCSDGSESRECPNQGNPVSCDVTQRDDGCLVKKCSDGQSYVSCPSSQDCKDYTDEKKCKIHECADGTKTRTCPDGATDNDCKVWTDDKGCQMKECSNGYVENSCDKAPTCKDSTEDGCTVTRCDDGSVTRKCPGKETVECKTYATDDGCKETICTDGKDDKVCPMTIAGGQNPNQATGLGSTTTTLPKAPEGGFLSNLFRSLGL